MTLWLVRSGKYGERESLALHNNIATIGWDSLPDLSTLPTRQNLYEALEAANPDEKGKSLSNWESQLWPFAQMMEKGDLIVMPLKTRAAIAIGRVSGPYRYRTDLGDARHTRPVEWLKEVPRTVFAQDLLYSFGSFMTVCRIARNNAADRVAAVLSGGSDPVLSAKVKLSKTPPHQQKTGQIAEADEATGSVDLAQFASDEIQKKIGAVFKGHKLSALIGALLEAQGYRVVVSPPGADGGVDIVAGKGILGFDHPRLVAQVKSQDAPVDVSVLRELHGVMRQFGAGQGLLVAWGGVTKALDKEAQRMFFEIRIWGADDVVRLLQENFENVPEDIRADLPLKRIWVLADSE